nr:uncharacterized mitochondrial protein AtMg00810-like [Nicotiana tomentosiformis]
MEAEIASLQLNHTWDVVDLPQWKKALPCKWVYKNGALVSILAVYVDDILLTGDDATKIEQITVFLNPEFRVKHLGDIHYFLGIEILKEKQGFIISQRKFTLELLHEFDCLGGWISLPFDHSTKLQADLEPQMDYPSLYLHLVDKLNCLTNTRPDLSFAILSLSQYMQRFCLSYFSAAQRVLRYLRTDPSQGILLSSQSSFDFLAFYDADCVACRDSRRSMSGFFITLGGAPISWKSKKQASISLSTVEAEYRSMCRVTT